MNGARILPLVVIGVSVVSQLMRSSSHVLGVVIASAVIALAAYPYIESKLNEPPTGAAAEASALINKREHEEVIVPSIDSPVFPISKFPTKGYKYMAQNQEFVRLMHKLRVVRMFDRPRFQETILTLDHLQKTYIYILGRRIRPSAGLPLFHDLRNRTLTLLYSFYFVVPPRLKHVYGLNPHTRIQDSIKAFAALSSKMNAVLRDFVRLELKEPWTYTDEVAPANQLGDAVTLP